MLLVSGKGEVVLGTRFRGTNGHLNLLLGSQPPISPWNLSLLALWPRALPCPLCACAPGPTLVATFTVPKSSSLMWPPPNSFFTVARVAAYSIFSRT